MSLLNSRWNIKWLENLTEDLHLDNFKTECLYHKNKDSLWQVDIKTLVSLEVPLSMLQRKIILVEHFHSSHLLQNERLNPVLQANESFRCWSGELFSSFYEVYSVICKLRFLATKTSHIQEQSANHFSFSCLTGALVTRSLAVSRIGSMFFIKISFFCTSLSI